VYWAYSTDIKTGHINAIILDLFCQYLVPEPSPSVAGFAARELRTRIEHAEPKVIIVASAGCEPNRVVR
jgi:propionyl-CoA synthetase